VYDLARTRESLRSLGSLERRRRMDKIGKYVFIVGLIIAFLASIVTSYGWVAWVLAILGVIVGFLNVSAEETRTFLISGIALLLVATSVQVLPVIGGVVSLIASNLIAFIAPAMFVVALKALFETARD
jgi:hypothetical protein